MQQIKLDDNTTLETEGNHARVIKNGSPGSWQQFDTGSPVATLITALGPERVSIFYRMDSHAKKAIAEIVGDAITYVT